jgi:hypothetical protein
MIYQCIYDKDTGAVKAYCNFDQDVNAVMTNYTNVAVVDVDVQLNKYTAGTFKIDLTTFEHVLIT